MVFAYREIPQESTGFSPFELVCGQGIRGPFDVLQEQLITSEQEPKLTTLRPMLLNSMIVCRKLKRAQEHLQKAQNKQKT